MVKACASYGILKLRASDPTAALDDRNVIHVAAFTGAPRWSVLGKRAGIRAPSALKCNWSGSSCEPTYEYLWTVDE